MWTIITADALKLNVSKENGIVISIGGDFTCIFNNHYLFMGDLGYRIQCFFRVLMLYVENAFLVNRREEHIFQILIRLDYPIRKLYGEPIASDITDYKYRFSD